MGGGKSQAINKFKKAKGDACLLIIDLDAPSAERYRDLQEHGL